MYCSPDKISSNKYTCFTKDALVKISKSYNETYGKNINIENASKRELWDNLRKELSNSCNNEWCWIDKDFVKKLKDDEISKFTFRPKMPSSWKRNKYTWLTTTDINEVMVQYEKKYTDFIFFGPVPADCPSSFVCELSNLDLKNMYANNISKIGIIFNLDKHNEPGSHWVGSFINIKTNKVYYYDSYGGIPPKLIKDFLINVADKIYELKGHVIVEYNSNRHQYGGSECGVYSMNFIVECLKNKTLQDIAKKPITDKSMNELRQYLYRSD